MPYRIEHGEPVFTTLDLTFNGGRHYRLVGAGYTEEWQGNKKIKHYYDIVKNDRGEYANMKREKIIELIEAEKKRQRLENHAK